MAFVCVGNIQAEEVPTSVGFNITMDGRVLCADVIVTGTLKMHPTNQKANLIQDKFYRTGTIAVQDLLKGPKDLKELEFKFLWTDHIRVKIKPKFKDDDSGLWLLVYNKKEQCYSLMVADNFLRADSENYDAKITDIKAITEGFESPTTKLNSEKVRVRAAAVYKIASRFDFDFSRKALENASNKVFSKKEIAKIQNTLKKESEAAKLLLEPKIDDPDPLTSLYASIILVHNYYDYKAVEKLIEHLKDESLNIRLLSATILHRYTGRTFIKGQTHLGDLWNQAPEKRKATLELWDEWWAENKDKHFIQWLIESVTESKEPLDQRGIPVDQLRKITGLKYLYNPYGKTIAERKSQPGNWKFWWWLRGKDFIKNNYPEWMKKNKEKKLQQESKQESKTEEDDELDDDDDF